MRNSVDSRRKREWKGNSWEENLCKVVLLVLGENFAPLTIGGAGHFGLMGNACSVISFKFFLVPIKDGASFVFIGI